MKSLLTNRRPGLGEDQVWEEKADQIRIYSGAKFRTVEEAPAGTVCAVTGLSRSRAGEGTLGLEAGWTAPALEPVLTYQVLLPRGRIPTLPWAICASWRRRIPSSTLPGMSRPARSTCS